MHYLAPNQKYFLLLLLCVFTSILKTNAQSQIIATGADWEYYDQEAPPSKDWISQTTPLDGWKTGTSPLGYGQSHAKTIISYGNDKKNKHITAYFRKVFWIENPADCIAYTMGIAKDDGAVVYLNGREIMRINMPEGTIDHQTKASSLITFGKWESYMHKKVLTESDFVAGNNIIAVSVHQGRRYSSDLFFNLDLKCENDPAMLPELIKEQSIKNLALDYKIKELDNKLIIEKKDSTIQDLKKSKSLYLTILFILAALLAMVSGLLFFNMIKKRKNDEELVKKINHLKNSQFNKSQELMSLSLSALQSQQFLKDVKNSLDEALKDNTASLAKETKRIIRQIDFNVDQDDDWLKLVNHFNATHKGYLDRLTKAHPSLSEIELRHCIFIKLHMQTKEIAKILHIDPRSVQAARYRIKKKMNFDESIDLRNYLLNF